MFKCEVYSLDTRAKNKLYTYQIKHDFAMHLVPQHVADWGGSWTSDTFWTHEYYF